MAAFGCTAILSAVGGVAPAQEVFSPNFGALEQPTGDRSYRPAAEVSGSGVVLATGNKIEVETDFSARGEMPLFLRRTYNHQWSASGLFGKHWISNLDYSLAASTSGSQVILWAQRPDGRRIKFVPSGEANRWNEDKATPVAYVLKGADNAYTLYNEERGSERYDSTGYVLQVKDEHGAAWAFTYNGLYLQRVTHTSGRYIQLTWNGSQLVQVLDPAGNAYVYSYTANAFGAGRNRLASVTLPGAPSTTVTYHYENSAFPGGLTGKSYNGSRYSTFAYDSNGRVASTELVGGVQRYTYEYSGGNTAPVTPPPLPPAPGGVEEGGGGGGWCEYQSGSRICFQPQFAMVGASGVAGLMGLSAISSVGAAAAAASSSTPFLTTETNPRGKRTTYQFEDDRLVSVSRAGSSSTPSAFRELQYDSNGYENLVSDFTDGLTDLDYDGHGHLVSRVDAAGTPLARTTLYVWDESSNRVVQSRIVGISETTLTYAPDGRVARIDVKNISGKGVPNFVQTTRFSYTKHANGLLASTAVDGPLQGSADTITSTFSTNGDLLSVRNELGHVTTYSNHNALGLAASVIDPNGAQIDYTYDGRGRVTAIKPIVNGAAQTTTLSYDGFGRLAVQQTPDGVARTNVYDSAWRPVEVYEREPAGTYARKLVTYDAMSLPIKTEVYRTTFPYNTQVIGNVEGVASNGAGGYNVNGWACSTGQDGSIDVHPYAGGGWPTGTGFGAFRADRPSEPAVASACGAQGAAYRFSIPLSDSVRDLHGGKAIYVHGISPAQKDNLLIAGSGVHLIPRLLPAVAPSGLSAPSIAVSSSYVVTWSAAPRATTYKLEESANGGGWTTVQDAAATSATISGKGGGTYSYRVAACNEVGCGPVSGPVTVLRVVAPSSAPTPSGPAVNDMGAYTVSVSAVSGLGSIYYVIDESANGGASWIQAHNGSAQSVYLSGRNTTIDYQYRARACNQAGCGPTSGVIVVQRAIYGAQFVWQGAFGLTLPGQVQNVTVQMRNTGNTTWTDAGGYRLGSQNPTDNLTWGVSRVGVPGSVAPGEIATFNFNVQAPSTLGYHNFQWRMVRDGYAWFGDQSPNSVKDVVTASISSSPASCGLYIGESTCRVTVQWTTTRGDGQVWVSNLDNTGMQLFVPSRSGSQSASWITTNGVRFHVMAAGVSLASVDVRAYQTNQYPPNPDPPPCPTQHCQEQ
ncbi:DUF6531 domain-containing protein [Lysobacter sp. S4-A87]|uniref:DUF6531 domain-containing protein n=1 Tax=Lysobacter sp. S4-A87 TaxID=2925843 RepID=UPI001F5324EC|nr:DUF6531 domain-containing protein [Lysobacter sp. S4-A87]UNK50562.1 DUF6531 domain-containing protein [Lysobacter sp. S4-A87]